MIAGGGKYVPKNTVVLDRTTSDIVMDYLKKQPSVSYQGRGQLHYIPTSVKKRAPRDK